MNGYTTTCCIYNLHHPIEPSKLPFNWIHILDSQIFFDALCICASGSRSKVYLKSLIRDLDLELEAIIAMSPPTTNKHRTRKLF